MSYGNMDNVASQVSGSSGVLASDWNTYVRDNFDEVKAGHVVLSSADRVALGTPVTGTMVFDSTLGVLMLWNGSAWVVSPASSVTTAQKGTLSGVPTGSIVYDSTLGYFQVYNGSAWINLSNSLAPSAGGSITGGGFLTGAASFSTNAFNLFGRAELRATFVKRNTASSVLATMHISGARFHTGIGNQSFFAAMYNPTSGYASVANLFAPSTGTYTFGGSAVIWSGLAAGSYTVEPAYRDNSVSSVTTFDGGGGAYGVASSSVAYTLLEIN